MGATVLAMAATGLVGGSEPDPPYPAPDLSVVLVDRGRIDLDDSRRQATVRSLTRLARNHADHPAITPLVRARALAVALALEPRDRDAVVANGQWRLGVRPRPLDDPMSLVEITSVILDSARALLTSGAAAAPENRHLASLLLAIGAAIDPALAGAAPSEADWRGAIPGDPGREERAAAEASAPAATASTPLPALEVERASLRAFVPAPEAGPSQAESGARSSGWRVVTVSCRARPRADDGPSTFRIEPGTPAGLRPVADLLGALSSGARPPSAPIEGVITLPPEAMAGGDRVARLLALPVALVADAPASSTHLDARIAVAGDLGADGGIEWIGGRCAPVLEAAATAGCRAVVVPDSCRDEFRDLVILDRLDLFRGVQILTAATFAEARALASEAGRVREGLDEFRILQLRAAQGNLSPSESRERLRRVLEAVPQHASAAFLAAASAPRDRSREVLSLPASRRLILEAGDPLVAATAAADDWVRPPAVEPETLGDIRSALIRLRPILAVEARSCADAGVDLARALERFQRQPPRSDDGRQKMAASLRSETSRFRRELAELDRAAAIRHGSPPPPRLPAETP